MQSGSMEEEKKGTSFFIKRIASMKCCFLILGFAYYKEEVETLLTLLSKSSRNYLAKNKGDIEGLRSLIDFKLTYPQDFMQLQTLDLSNACLSFRIGSKIETEEEMQLLLGALYKVAEKYPTCTLRHF